MRTPDEAARFLAGTEVFENRAVVWRALLECNPELLAGRCADDLTNQQVDDILKENADNLNQLPHPVRWKVPQCDHWLTVNDKTCSPGYRPNQDMGPAHLAASRLQQRVKAGKFKQVRVRQHYHVVAGIVLDNTNPS